MLCALFRHYVVPPSTPAAFFYFPAHKADTDYQIKGKQSRVNPDKPCRKGPSLPKRGTSAMAKDGCLTTQTDRLSHGDGVHSDECPRYTMRSSTPTCRSGRLIPTGLPPSPYSSGWSLLPYRAAASSK